MKIDDVASEYFRCIRERDAEGLTQFFAEDAARLTYKGVSAYGSEAVLDLYFTQDFAVSYVWHLPDGSRHVPGPDEPQPIGSLRPLLPALSSGNESMVQVEVQLNDGSAYRVVDIFTLNDEGLVTQVLVYKGPHVPPDAPSS